MKDDLAFTQTQAAHYSLLTNAPELVGGLSGWHILALVLTHAIHIDISNLDWCLYQCWFQTLPHTVGSNNPILFYLPFKQFLIIKSSLPFGTCICDCLLFCQLALDAAMIMSSYPYTDSFALIRSILILIVVFGIIGSISQLVSGLFALANAQDVSSDEQKAVGLYN